MRKALNENPVVQISVLAVIGLVLVFMLFTTVLKKEEAPAAAVAGDPAVAPAVTEIASAPAAETQAAPSASAAADLVPGEGLPKDVVVAIAKERAVALLVVDPKGIADKRVENFTKRLSARDNVEVIVVDVKDVADYSRVTFGVAVSRAPALVVIRPRELTADVPTASVSYGFRSPRSVEQALDDALYEGDVVTSYP